jgi:BirA family transcriptional regulator, biotin operon repressor / biotin---[acetyl-CoA-carboxylase] ligase
MTSINQKTEAEFQKKHLPVFFEEKTDSTNAWAKKEFHGQNPFALYLADEQSHGRGRGANTWSQAVPGSTLLSTWCLRLAQTPQPLFPLRVGLLLFETCLKIWPQLDWALKAPNDIYILDAKWAGILIEVTPLTFNTCCFIGVGANIYDKPNIASQKTTALSDWVDLQREDWAQFCYTFYEGLINLQKDPARQTLLAIEIQALEYGLKKYLGNNIQKVMADGSLMLKSGETIHWSEL